MATRHASSRSPSPFSKSAYNSPQRPSKRTKGAPGILASHRVFILQPKLSQTEISEIFDLAESADADIVSSPDEADIIVTTIGMRKRLERHIEWNLAVSVKLLPSLVWDRIFYSTFDYGDDGHGHQHRNESVS
jgi:DNA polymerase IV